MKFQAIVAAGLAATVNAHTIFQKISVNGADQGSLVGFRAPPSNNPVYDVTSNDIICQASGSQSSTIINVPAGAKVGTFWGHVIGGAQYNPDPDNPIASSHKGPISVYLAKVSNAATTAKTGLSWFKVAHEGLSGGKWAVDTMIAGGGWWYFTLPSCVASGNYLMRVELWGLHNAYDSKGAQFYSSCVQINVQNGGSFTPSSTVSFPGAYAQNDKGILLNIYGSGGQPNNNNQPYPIPGPSPISCSGQSNGGGSTGGNPTTTTTTTTRPAATTTTTSRAAATTTAASGGSGAALYAQCGGSGYSGPTTCASGTCKKVNDYYSQCQP